MALTTVVLALAGCANPSALVRSDHAFSRVAAGMTQAEVRTLIGPPDEAMRFPLLRSEAWDYRFQDTWGYIAVFSVTFGPDGIAAGKTTVRVNDGGDHGN